MVGVAGRSRGCKTCRRARVKCDETRPSCKRCVRLKRTCESFPPYPVFLDCFTHREIRSEDEHGDDDKSNTLIYASPSLDEENIFLTYLVKNLFTDLSQAGESTFHLPYVLWATMLSNKRDSFTQLAVGALAAVYYGKQQFNQKAVSRGSMLYTRALAMTRTDLRDPKRVLDTTTLTNVMFLVLYELVAFKDTTGWLTHLLGIGEIIKLRGPHRHRMGLDRELFQMTRYSIVLGHLITSKHCFLEGYAWKVVPWANDPDSKSTIDYLIDILCDVPGILEDLKLLDNFPTTLSTLQTLWFSVGSRIQSCIENLYLWRTNWNAKFPSAAYSVGLDILKDLKVTHLETYPFSAAVFFDEPFRATELCLYDCVLILLYRAQGKIPPSIVMMPSPSEDCGRNFDGSVLLPTGQGSIQDIVSEICTMVYYQLSGYPGNTGAMQLIFPLQLASRNLDSESKESKWVSQMISHLADVQGFGAVKYAQGAGVPIVV